MDPKQVQRDPRGVLRCRECGFAYELEPRGVASETESGLSAVEAAVDETPVALLSRRPAPDVWSVNAYAAHLEQAAEVIAARVTAIAVQDVPLLPNHDQDAAVEAANGDTVPAQRSLERLRPTVQAFIAAIRRLPPDAWERIGVHSAAGEVRLADVAHDMPHELQHHAQDIRYVHRSLLQRDPQ